MRSTKLFGMKWIVMGFFLLSTSLKNVVFFLFMEQEILLLSHFPLLSYHCIMNCGTLIASS